MLERQGSTNVTCDIMCNKMTIKWCDDQLRKKNKKIEKANTGSRLSFLDYDYYSEHVVNKWSI